MQSATTLVEAPHGFLLVCNWSVGVFEHGANTCNFMCKKQLKRHLVVNVDIQDYQAVTKLELPVLKRLWALQIDVEG